MDSMVILAKDWGHKPKPLPPPKEKKNKKRNY